MRRFLITLAIFFELFLFMFLGVFAREAAPQERITEIPATPESPVIERFIMKYTHRALRRRWKKLTASITDAILTSAQRFQLDPLLILAVIERESRFHPLARGTHGEIGLMQLKPRTAHWIARLSGLRWDGARTLRNPHANILLGSAYLCYLRGLLPEPAQMLAAYNMGASRMMRLARDNFIAPVYAREVHENCRRYHQISATVV